MKVFNTEVTSNMSYHVAIPRNRWTQHLLWNNFYEFDVNGVFSYT